MVKKTILFNDHLVANSILALILFYLGASLYRYIEINSYPKFSWVFLVMLIPVFLSDGLKTLMESFYPKKIFPGNENLSKVNVIIPTINGEKVVGKTIEDLLRRFPKESIIVSSNGSTDKTCEIARNFGVVLLENEEAIGKVEAINQALSLVKTQYVLIMDDDTLIGDAKIPTGELDDGREGVAFRVLPIKAGFYSFLQMHEYRKSMDVGRRFHNHTASVQNISGAIGLFRTKELMRQRDIHNGEFSGEDLQRTLLVHLDRKEKGGVIMSESVVETLVPDGFFSLFRQRVYGWYPGFLNNFTLYIKLMLKRETPFRLRFESFYNCIFLAFLDPLRLIALPVLIFTPSYFLFFYLVYLLIEIVPYLAMGKKEPAWILLFFPIYGILNFIARILSFGVFFYRRSAQYLRKTKQPDVYRNINNWQGALAFSCSLLIFITLFAIYYIGSKYSVIAVNQIPKALLSNKEETLLIPVSSTTFWSNEMQSVSKNPVSTISAVIVVEANAGDSQWKVAKKAVDLFSSEKPDEISNKEVFIDWVIILWGKQSVHKGDIFNFNNALMEEALKSSFVQLRKST